VAIAAAAPCAGKRMTASCSYDGKSKTERRLSGSDPHGAIQIRSFGGKMKIVNLWLMPALRHRRYWEG
jgi:hypothetical protein